MRTYSADDALGSVHRTLADNGTPSIPIVYDPFGTPQSGEVPTFGFTGELYDAGLNNIYLRARWYTPSSGSFISRDPFSGFDQKPYSLHPYQYGYAAPTMYTDPSGECVGWVGDVFRYVAGKKIEGKCKFAGWGDPNWEDGGEYVETIVDTSVEAATAVVTTVAHAMTEEGRATMARGAQFLVNDPVAATGVLVKAQFDPLQEVYQGFLCEDDKLIARGLTNTAIALWGARGVKGPSRGWLHGDEGAIRANLAKGPFYMPKGVPKRRTPRSVGDSFWMGRTFYLGKPLNQKYPNGVNFTIQGYPDFHPYALVQVRIKMTGIYWSDFADANKAAGFAKTPEGYTWHHHHDRTTRLLVPKDLHGEVRHTGGVAVIDEQGQLP